MNGYPVRLWRRNRCHDSLLIVHPVGDGNALELQNWGTALMDCGGDDRALQVLHSASARGMSEFLLTHFHTDHYSGVTNQPAGTKLVSDVYHVYLPALPLIENRSLTERFALALFTINAVLGDKSGVPEQDLIDAFTSLNPIGSVPTPAFLSKGDYFDLAGTPFEVLWPPRAISGLVAKSAKKAVEEFEEAITQNEHAKNISDKLREQASHAANRAQQAAHNAAQRAANEVVIVEDSDNNDGSADVEEGCEIEGEIPETLRSANKAIRNVANRLSLAFRSGSRLIHLGDLETAELNQVVTDLGRATDFFGMVAAHHGTHFSRKMDNLEASHIIASNGKRRPNVKTGYYRIGSYIQETNVHGHAFLRF